MAELGVEMSKLKDICVSLGTAKALVEVGITTNRVLKRQESEGGDEQT